MLYSGPPVPAGIRQVFADAEQARQTGGMVALYPRADDAMQMAVPNGEQPQELHLTLVYLGEDVENMGSPDGLAQAVAQFASSYTVITARVMGHGLFNPDGGEDGSNEPCVVYLIGDAPQLPDLHSDVLSAANSEFNVPAQHVPWIPHVTCGYNIPIGRLSFTGQVMFDRIGLAFGGSTRYLPLMGATVSEYTD